MRGSLGLYEVGIMRADARARFLGESGEWNRLTARCTGHRVVIAINGVQTAEFETGQGDSSGPVSLQPRKGEVEFREIWIKQ